MVQELFHLSVVFMQMVGLIIIAIGCFLIAGAVFSGRPAGFVKGAVLIIIGGYLGGFAAALH